MTCVDYLTTILAGLALRHIPSPQRDKDGVLRVIANGPDFESLLAESFEQIRANVEGNLEMMLSLLCALRTLAGLTGSPRHRWALREQTEWISELAGRAIASVHEHKKVEVQLARVRAALEPEPVVCAGLH